MEQAREIQNIMSAVINADADGDHQFTEDEIHRLMLQLRGFTNRPHDAQRLRQSLRGSKSLGSVARITQSHFQTYDAEISTGYHMM